MKKIIVIATEDERKLVDELFPDTKYKVIVTGVGGVNVIEKLRKVRKNCTIINIGYAGSNFLPIGMWTSITFSQLHQANAKFKSPIYPLEVGDKKLNYTYCYTSSDFVKFTRIKRSAVFDMELAFICALGFKSVTSYKKVSDKLDYKQYEHSIRKEGKK